MLKRPRTLGIYGAGGFGQEVAWLSRTIHSTVEPPTLYFVDDKHAGESVANTQVLSLEQFAALDVERKQLVIAVGSPAVRRVIATAVQDAGVPFGNVIDPVALDAERLNRGDGVVICRGSVLTVDITLGHHVHVNLNCTIGHNAVLGDFVTLSPGVHVSGWVEIGSETFVGTGAVFVNGTADRPLRVGRRCVIGAGAVVTKDVPDEETWVGVPARRRG